jgi:hypothetical protein
LAAERDNAGRRGVACVVTGAAGVENGGGSVKIAASRDEGPRMSVDAEPAVAEANQTATTPPPAPAWSAEQVVRISQEWRQAQWNFAYHPVIRILPLEGDPPGAYHVEYRLRNLVVNDAGELAFAEACAVEIVLGVDFPHSAPLVKPLQQTFHPNVDGEAVRIIPAWKAAGSTLSDVVQRIGQLMAYRVHDAGEVWNPAAMQWLGAHREEVPTDRIADVSLTAGGEPLERICRAGPAALGALREQVQLFTEWLMDPVRPPGGGEVRHFVQRTRVATRLFLQSDLPEALSSQAAQIDKWAAALPALAAACAAMRNRATVAKAAVSASAELTENCNQLVEQLGAVDRLGNGATAAAPPGEFRQVLRQLPAAVGLQKAHGVLRGMLLKAEQRLAGARSALGAVSAPKLPAALPASARAAVEARAGEQSAEVEGARRQAGGAVDRVQALVERARREAAALERVLRWREFADLIERARTLLGRASELGPAGVQAYFIRNGGGEHGPFQFEQQVDLDEARVVVRRTSTGGIEAVDVTRGLSLGRAEGGAELAARIRPEDAEATIFRPTPLCEELAVQFEYAVNETKALLDQLAAPWRGGEASQSWCGRIAAVLGRPESIARAREDRSTLAFRWASLAADLRALEPIKQRLATYFLLVRVSETLPRYREELAAARAADQKATDALGPILARSTVDPATGAVVIPAKFHKEYQTLVAQRDGLERQVERLSRAIRTGISQGKARMASNATIGHAQVGHFAVLPPVRPPMAEAVAAMADEPLLALLTEVERLAGATLYAGKRPAGMVGKAPAPPGVPWAGMRREASGAAVVSAEVAAAHDALAVDAEPEAEGEGGDLVVDWPGT